MKHGILANPSFTVGDYGRSDTPSAASNGITAGAMTARRRLPHLTADGDLADLILKAGARRRMTALKAPATIKSGDRYRW